jgi:hypothetical protein
MDENKWIEGEEREGRQKKYIARNFTIFTLNKYYGD